MMTAAILSAIPMEALQDKVMETALIFSAQGRMV
jgi:hypothetical protein